MNLFLDDERNPAQVKWVELPLVEWRVVRSYDEFVQAVKEHGIPKRVSFDHDLACEHYAELRAAQAAGRSFSYETLKEKTGYHVLYWLLNECADRRAQRPEMFFHSFNPVGRDNMIFLMKAFDRNHPGLVPCS